MLWERSIIGALRSKLSNRVKCDINALSLKMRQAGEKAVRGASEVMTEGGKEIARRAKEYAPRDTGALEKSITFEKDRSGIRGRTQVFIYIDENVRRKDGRFVGEYAEGVHEYLAPYGSGAWGHISAKSAAKGEKVGGKFFERAIEEILPWIEENIEKRAKRAAKG